MDFNIDSVYEEFKIEQFRHGYTRKDEPRMRKAFFVEKGIDPVYQDQVNKGQTQKKTKRKWPKVVLMLILLVALLLGAGYFLATNKRHVRKPNKQAAVECVLPTKNACDHSQIINRKI